jgi:hypothetical protein
MALDVEGVLDGGVNGQEPLGCSQLLEALHLAHTSSSRLMRILGAIALAQALLMVSRQSDFGLHRTLRAKLIGHQNIKREALFLKQLAHEFHGRSLVAPPLDKKVETSPSSSTARTAATQSSRPSLRGASARLAAGVDAEVLEQTTARTSKPITAPFRRRHPDIQTTLREQIFDVAIAEPEAGVEPNGEDDRRRKLF